MLSFRYSPWLSYMSHEPCISAFNFFLFVQLKVDRGIFFFKYLHHYPHTHVLIYLFFALIFNIVLFSFLSAWQKLETRFFRDEKPQLRKCLHQIVRRKFALHLLGSDWCESSASSGLVVLGSIIKQIEQALGNKPVSSISPRSLLQFLPWVPVLGSCPDFPFAL